MPNDRGTSRCSWCGTPVQPGEGYRAAEHPGARHAVFCRLEHIVPWSIQGAHWDAGEPDEPAGVAAPGATCAHCEAEIGEVHVQLMRHRGEYRVPDEFCSAAHMGEWAKGGGRWR